MKSPKKILVIEDEEEISRAVAFRLGKQGFHVSVAGDGENGLAMALKNLPDIILLDLFLPGISGEEVCKAIREHEDKKIQRIPIIMLTAKSMMADKIIGKVIGADVYLTKPFEMDHLLEMIDQLMAGHKPVQGVEFYTP